MKRIIKKFILGYEVNKDDKLITGSITMYSANRRFAKTKLRTILKRDHGDDIKIKIT